MWKIGGDSYPDPSLDSTSMTALRTALEVGYTHFDTAEGYASGHSEELLGRAIRETNTKREKLFITTKISPEHLAYDQVFRSCENSLRRINVEYVDLYLIHWPPRAGTKLEETFRALEQAGEGWQGETSGCEQLQSQICSSRRNPYRKRPFSPIRFPIACPTAPMWKTACWNIASRTIFCSLPIHP